MADGRTRRVFVEMVREEWRLYGRLFQGSHFASFPVVVALIAAGATWALVTTGTAPTTVFAGLHALALVFGIHTGTLGLVGRDALQRLLGDVTLLIGAARTLPLSHRQLFGVFVAKDVVYYAALFLVPISLGATAAVAGVTGSAGFETPFLLWMTLTLTFVLGMGATITGLGIVRRGVPGVALLVAILVPAGALWAAEVDIVADTPYGAFLEPTLPRIGAATTVVLAVLALAVVSFDPTARRPARTVAPAFRRWWRRIGDPVATKTLLDVHRSAGGFGKVLFSAGVLLGVTAGLLNLAGRITGVAPSVGVSFGTILGLSGFTTYNWLTQSDDVDAYLVHPLSVEEILTAKFRAFLLLGPAVGIGFYALALGWHGTRPLEALVGGILLVGVACYIFGTTVYLTGLSPNEFLFDTALFAAFGVAMIVPLVPILVVGFALAPVATPLLVALAVAGMGLSGVGVALYRRAIPRWETRYRER
ncbi:hypothetical protein [Haloplanus halobius]|uniref:hypothetical protein n=1 Tax=Haloplanus halobius TaxID=2934938 RepID=UPI00200CE32A|nr:hypothetical protein [Haloplanus sp. XH21]